MENKEYILLMTACIKPSEDVINSRTKFRGVPEVRLNDYKISLKYWLKYKDLRIVGIVFIENSGSNLHELKKIASEYNIYNRKLEFLQYKASQIPNGVSYGYSELEMLDNAFCHSSLMKSYNYFIKVTGRLYFPKLTSLLNIIPPNILIAIDSRDYKIFKKSKQYMLTTLFIVQKDFYIDVLYSLKDKMIIEGNGVMEVLFYKFLKPLYIQRPNEIIVRFPHNVEPVGVGAHWNSNYSSPRKKIEAFLRSIVRLVYPSLWV